MTHMTNYKCDRLATRLLDASLPWLRNWTRLQLLTQSPDRLPIRPGMRHPPLHTDPCTDRHHRSLWPRRWSCANETLPQVLIVGPQKTGELGAPPDVLIGCKAVFTKTLDRPFYCNPIGSGSTALMFFLRLHPLLRSTNRYLTDTFEEVQFFSSDRRYSQGVHWYMNQFSPTRDSQIRGFEKSATYFDSPKSPERVAALLPKVKLIVLLLNPVDRAYSWYQVRFRRSALLFRHAL